MSFNCTSVGNNSEEAVEAYLEHLEESSNISMAPAVVMLIVFAVVGLVGNILVLAVYSQKARLSPTNVLIMTIACLDLVADLGAIPSEINGMFYAWTFRHTDVCKAKVSVVAFTATGGAISLCIVAVIRYRKVCCPYGWQVTKRQAVISSIATAVISFLFSVPYVVLFGITTRPTPCPNIKGRDCFVQDTYLTTIWPLLNNMMFFLLYFSLSISMVVMYILIGVTAWKHSALHGVSAQTTIKKTTVSKSSSGMSSEQKVSRGSDGGEVSIQANNSSIFAQRKVNILYCCLENQGKEKNENGVALKTFTTTTTSTDICEPNSSLINNDGGDTNSGVMATLEAGVGISNLGNQELTENNEECRASQTIRSGSIREEYLSETQGSADDVKEINPEQENEIPRHDSNPQKIDVPRKTKHGKKIAKRRPLGRTTAILIIITAIFVFSYLPFLSLSVYKTRLPDKYASLSVTESAFFNFFFRIYFMNSAANPIVYSLCDLNFRRECFSLLSCTFKRRL